MDRPISESEAALRLTRLSEASLRINESLDFDTVLQGALDSARSLTAASHGVMILLDNKGWVENFLSSGLTSEDSGRLWLTPEGLRIFQALTGVSEPTRVPDLAAHVRARGFPGFTIPMPVGPVYRFMSAPMFHRRVRVGHIFVGGKDGGEEFSQADEETLVMFASQAALVIANARTHREERQARIDLETLIDSSPVAVVVFDAHTGTPKSFNREAHRLADSLRDPDQTPETLLDVMTCIRADGREVSLREFPLAELLRVGEILRAEEIVLRVPDGRRVTVLLNATPVLSEQGVVESVVVTMQDMADVEELERMRAEFLAMVSHELRMPLAAVKGSVATVLESPTDLDPAVVRQFLHIIGDQADHMHRLVSDLLDVARIETGTLAVSPEPAEVIALVGRARSTFTNAGGWNPIHIDIGPDLPLVLADRRSIVQVLNNLLSNAAQHSPPSSVITVDAVREGVHVVVSVADEGRGIPAEDIPRLFRKFSGVQSEEHPRDTGLGLAICEGIVEAHGGRIWVESDGPGLGARFAFTLPTVDDTGGAAVSGCSPAPARSRRHGQRELGEPVRVLAVDGDPKDLRYVRDTLIHSGYVPTVTADPGEALRLMEEERPHLVLLDILLPGTDTIKLMKDMLATTDVPVIFLSAYGQDETVARALDIGAADYVAKPFSPTELVARIAAALRRREVPEPQGPYVLGDLTVDHAERRVTIGDRPVHLLPMEYRMLTELAAGAGRVLTYEYLLERVWGERGGSDLRPMRTIVRKLRRKLGDDASNPSYIFTESRVGYWMPKGQTMEVGES